jgi:NAD(P)H-hydrate epimerase
MKVLTGSEMRSIDRWAIEKLGIPGMALMENAGRGAVDVLESMFSAASVGGGRTSGIHRVHVAPTPALRDRSSLRGLKVVILCGPGNNGGDGFVMARHLAHREACPRSYLVGAKRRLRGDARLNLDIAIRASLPIFELTSPRQLPQLRRDLAEADVVVDALFGTGFGGAVQGLAARVIEAANASSKPILAVDIASGIDADSGHVDGPCIRADATATMGFPKRGHFLHPGKAHTGDLWVVDIGLPSAPPELQKVNLSLITRDAVRLLLPRRPADGHKGTFGHVFVVSGSVGFTGASALASLAALRTGAGVVTLGLPASLNDALEAKLTEVMTLPLPETRDRTLAGEALLPIQRFCQKASVLAVGPGLSTNARTQQLVRDILAWTRIPTVVDADGLNALSGHEQILRTVEAPVVMSPHPGELSRLIGVPAGEIDANRVETARMAASRLGVPLALKGAPTVVAHPSGEAWVNPTGNSGLATAGSGDVLTGVIAGLMAQGLSPFDAATAGVYLHGMAGDLAAQKRTEYGVIAGDLLEGIPRAIRILLSNEE